MGRGPIQRRDATAGRSRGQTTLDFAIGVSLFLSVMLFVFAFVPGILQPFNLSGEQDTVHAERIAAKLSQSMLGDASTPYVLDTTCTVAFFDTGIPPAHCNYGGSDLDSRLDLADGDNVNITLEGTLAGSDGDVVCWDASAQRLAERGDLGCDLTLTTGGDPPTAHDATVTSRRVVSLSQQNVTMTVVVW